MNPDPALTQFKAPPSSPKRAISPIGLSYHFINVTFLFLVLAGCALAADKAREYVASVHGDPVIVLALQGLEYFLIVLDIVQVLWYCGKWTMRFIKGDSSWPK